MFPKRSADPAVRGFSPVFGGKKIPEFIESSQGL
jgi:hypothetical protein